MKCVTLLMVLIILPCTSFNLSLDVSVGVCLPHRSLGLIAQIARVVTLRIVSDSAEARKCQKVSVLSTFGGVDFVNFWHILVHFVDF